MSLDFLEALENLEKEYNELQKDEVYQILQNEDNCFRVTSVFTNQDDLYVWEEILECFGLLNAEGNLRCQLKILQLKHSLIKTNKVFTCLLTGNWAETDIEINDEVQIFGKFNPDYLAILIQNASNQEQYLFNQHFIIVEPGFLLNPTVITSSLPCFRRSIISSYIAGRDEASLPMIKG